MLSAEGLFIPEKLYLAFASNSDGPRGKLKKSKDLTTIKQKSTVNHLMMLHIHRTLAKDMELTPVANQILLRKSDRKEHCSKFVQNSSVFM